MKKAVMLLCFAAMLFVSCTQSAPKDAKANTLVIWAEAHSKQGIERLVDYLDATTASGFDAEVIALPNNDNENYDDELKRLRTELMAGNAPDLFILNSYSTLTSSSFLFTDIEKTMRAGVFQDLTDWFDNNTQSSYSNLIEPVMKAGLLDGKRYIIPLQYNLYHVYGHQDKFENIDTTKAGENLYAFNEEFSKKPELLANIIATASTWLEQPLLNYNKGTLDFDKSAIESSINANVLFKKALAVQAQMSPIQFSSGYARASSLQDTIIVPKANNNGFITPVVASYAMVYSSSKRTEQAMQLIELLLSEPLQKGGALIHNDKSYVEPLLDTKGSIVFLQPTALPVKKGCNQDSRLAQFELRLSNALLLSEGDKILEQEIRKAVETAVYDSTTPNFDKLYAYIEKNLSKYISE